MTIDKAIETLTSIADDKLSHRSSDFHNALKLLIEAGKAILAERTGKVVDYRHPLPGETPENYHPNTEAILKKLQESPLGKKPEA